MLWFNANPGTPMRRDLRPGSHAALMQPWTFATSALRVLLAADSPYGAKPLTKMRRGVQSRIVPSFLVFDVLVPEPRPLADIPVLPRPLSFSLFTFSSRAWNLASKPSMRLSWMSIFSLSTCSSSFFATPSSRKTKRSES